MGWVLLLSWLKLAEQELLRCAHPARVEVFQNPAIFWPSEDNSRSRYPHLYPRRFFVEFLTFRKFNLTAHIICSVGWLGAVATFLALSVFGVFAGNDLMARAVYISMEVISWAVIVPCCVLALVTGLTHSLDGQWGLLRHYWVLLKFLLTCGASLMLIVHMQPIINMSQAAAASPFLAERLGGVQRQLVFDASLTLAVLLSTTILSVYKPWGLTGYGRRKIGTGDGPHASTGNTWGRTALVALLLLLLLFVLLHLAGRGLGGH